MLAVRNLKAGEVAAFLAALLLHGGAVTLLLLAKPTEKPAIPRVENFRMVELPSRPVIAPPPPIVETLPEPVVAPPIAPSPRP
jgi:hypothetical protein